MTQLIELIFERITPEQAIDLLTQVGGVEAGKYFSRKIGDPSDGVVDFAVESVEIAHDSILNDVHLRLLRYNDCLDVEVNFEMESVTGKGGYEFQRDLCDFASSVAENSGVSTYFGGLEPAADKDTRLFTGLLLGPVKLHDP